MSSYDYLADGLVRDGAMPKELAGHAAMVATEWIAAKVDPARIEVLAEFIARVAAGLGDGVKMDSGRLAEASRWLELSAPLDDFLRAAVPSECDRDHVAAVAVHLVDIGERMALERFVPELPALFAKSERTGEAARTVGAARYLRG